MIGRLSFTALAAILATQTGAQDANQTAGAASAVAIEGVVANFQGEFRRMITYWGFQLIISRRPDCSRAAVYAQSPRNSWCGLQQQLSAHRAELDCGWSVLSTWYTFDMLTVPAVSDAPIVSFTPAANLSSSTYTSDDRFTLALVDADIVGTDESANPQTRHWLVNSVGLDVGATGGWAVNYTSATNITQYTGPGPAAGSGPHRYVFLLYAQPSSFQAPFNLSTADTPLGTFFINSYVSESGLGDLVAANYMQVENGVATMSIPQTTTVDSSTLAGYGSTAASAATTASGSGSKSSGASASGSAASGSSSPKSAAGKQQPALGWTMIAGAVGVVGTLMGAGLAL